MAYNFSTQITGSTKAKIVGESKEHTLNGITARNSDANVVMAGLSTMYGLVGWTIQDIDSAVTRTSKEDIINGD